MDFAKCVRCGKAFNKVRSPVCPACTPEEDADFTKIRDALSNNPHLSVKELAEAAGVTLACVLRMIDDGQLVEEEVVNEIKCGRCGKPAMTAAKRLCLECLMELERDVAANVGEIREKLEAKKDVLIQRRSTARARAYEVHQAIVDKRRVRPVPLRRVR